MGWVRRIATGLVAVVGIGLAGVGALLLGVYRPADVEEVPVQCRADAPALPVDAPVKVLVWNVQYAGSRAHHFFYDGGDAVHVPETDVRTTLDAIADVVRDADPDVILWQELDRDSARTHRIDQHAALLERLDYPCDVSAPYHRARYVPHPPQQHMGRIDMHLAVFSRYRIDHAERLQLPLLDEPWWRRAFNLKRALLRLEMPLDDGRTFQMMTTHLSAFSMRDGTLDKQMATLDEVLTGFETTQTPWLLAGDFNALPPGDDPSRLDPDHAALYEPDRTPIDRLFKRFASAVSAKQYLADPQRWRTYLPFGASEADRAIDYAFHGRTVAVHNMVVRQDTAISDHLPITLEFRVDP